MKDSGVWLPEEGIASPFITISIPYNIPVIQMYVTKLNRLKWNKKLEICSHQGNIRVGVGR